MAGFEVIVRPVVFPDIRPRARQSLPPQDDPEKGFAVIKGQPAQTIGLSSSNSVGTSQSRPVEFGRRVDLARIYQIEAPGGGGGDGGGGGGGGSVNTDNFVDMKVANRIETGIDELGGGFGNISPGAGGGGGGQRTITYYRSIDKDEAENIEIQIRNKIEPNLSQP